MGKYSIQGAGGGGGKGGSKNARKPDIQKDSVASVSTLKELLGLSEGEVEGFVTDDPRQSIYLENTPLADDNGNDNFTGVSYEFVEGTNDQSYIKGFPDVSNEIGVNVELKQGTPYVKAINNTQLSATRVRLRFGRLAETNAENGDITGTKVEYAIDLQTDGGAYETVVNGVVDDKASAGYERTHRIDLPKANTGWQIRVRRLTPNSDSDLIQNDMFIDAIAEVIDAKLRYPNTAMLGLSYDAETFQSVAKVAVHLKGKRILVPSNYNAYERTYTGLWNGTFKEAYSNNPAWVMYDLLTQWRYGLGDRIDASMVDKWSLYQLGQYCDQMVDDGKGGQEPRFTCNVYLQKQEDAFTVLSNIAGIFRAMSYWNGERIVLDADMPQDPVYTFSRANVVDGLFNYTGSRARDRHTLVKVAWDNPANNYQTEYEFVRDERGMAKYGVRVLDLSAFACTSQAQAQRAGLWALETEQLETRQVSFAVGLDGFIPQVGNIVNISDELFAGRANGGRVSEINGSQITLDREVTTGDTLVINGRDGRLEKRTITAINGRVVTVNAAFNNAEVQNVWAIESADLMLMQFRVMSITQNDDMTFNITALQHEPQKYDAIDYGVHVEPTPITVINPDTVSAPDYVNLSATYRVVQGQNVATLVIEWEQVKDAVAYEVEWRKDNGTWIRLPRTGNTSIDIEGIYSGKYQARVHSISAFDVSSQPKVSNLTDIQGKAGRPDAPTMLKATGLLFGMRLEWSFAQGSGDTDYTEIEQATAPDTNVSLLGQFSYPTDNHDVTGLQGDLTLYYRARIVDKLGFKSDWTDWVEGVTDGNPSKIMDMITGEIKESHLYKDLGEKIEKIEPLEISVGQIEGETERLSSEVERVEGEAKQELNKQKEAVNQAKARADQAVQDVLAEARNRQQQIDQMQEGFNQSIDEVDTKAGSALTKAESALTKTGQNAALIQSKVKTLTDADQSLSESIQEVAAISGQNQTAISDEVEARSNAIESVGTRIGKVETTANGNVTRIGKLEKTTASNTEAISQARTDLTARFNTAIDDLEIGGRNLARNDFVKGRYWQHDTGDTGSSWEHTGTKDKLLVGGGGEYTFSLNKRYGYLRYPRWVAYDSSGKYIKGEVYSNGNHIHEWTFTAPDNTRYITLSSEHQGSSYKYWKLEKGTKATDWTPAPEDVDASISANTALISQEAEARATALEATGKRIDVVNTEVGKANTAITSERSARTEADQAIGKRVDTLQTEVNGNKSSITRIDKSITDTNESIAQAKTDLRAEFKQGIEDIEIGGRNLILNTDFSNLEEAGKSWESNGGGFSKYTDAQKGIVVSSTLPAGITYKDWIELEVGQTYTYSGSFYTVENDISVDSLTPLHFWLSDEKDPTKNYTLVSQSHTTIPKGKWVRIHTVFVARSKYFRPIIYGGNSGRFYVTELKLEKGTKATDWTPAPEDVQAGIEANKASIVQESQARADANSAMGSRIDGINTKVDENKTAITSESQARADAVSAVGRRVDGINTEVGKNKSSITALTKSVSDANKAISQARTDLTASFQKGLDDLEIGGANLQVDSKHARVISAFDGRVTKNEIIEITDFPPEKGTSTVRSISASGSSNGAHSAIRWGGVPPETPATISFWIKNTNSFDIAVYTFDMFSFSSATPSSVTIPAGEWVKVVYTGTTRGAYDWGQIFPKAPSKSQAYSYLVARFKIERGNKATDWTPAPEDVQADIDATQASLDEFKQSQATKDGATSQKLTQLEANLGTKANSTTVNQLSNKVEQVDGKINAEAQKVSTLQTTVNNNTAAIASEQTARANADSALTNQITQVSSKVNANESAIQTESQTRASQDNALSQRITTVQSSTATAQSTADNALSKVNVANQNIATIESDLSAVTTQSGATAESVETLQTTVNGHTSSIQEQQSSIDGLSAESTLTLDVNGYVTGVGSYNDGKKGTFAVRADEFWVASPDNKSKVRPLVYYPSSTTINGVVVPSGLYLDGNIVATGSITGDKIRAETEIKAPVIKGGQININDKFMVDSDGNMTAIDGYFEGDIAANSIDVETLKRSAWTPAYKLFIHPADGTNIPYKPSDFDGYRKFSGSHVSYGSITQSFTGYKNNDIGGALFEIELDVLQATTVKQRVEMVDDSVRFYINGGDVDGNPNVTVTQWKTNVSYTLPKGKVLLQIVLTNEQFGDNSLVLLGDFINNHNVKFA